MANVLVCGANGQLGSTIQAILPKEDNYFYTDKTALDITDKSAVAKFLCENRIKILVNCAGYTAVDRAEDEVEKANLLNNVAVRNLAEICVEKHVFLIHISTDYVFDGQKNTPYTETDLPNPQTVYGTTKWQGEKAIQEICTDYLILRTAWLYSPYGHNFVKTIERLAKERKELKVVADQMGTPTNAMDLAHFIVYFIATKKYEKHRGIYHFSNGGVTSWYEFAKEIVSLLGIDCEVKPIATEEYPTKAVRPKYSVLDTTKIKADFNIEIPYWFNSLEKMNNACSFENKKGIKKFRSDYGVFCCEHILKNNEPVLLVIRDPDGYWQFFCGDDDKKHENCHHIAVGHLIAKDTSLEVVANLEVASGVERKSVNDDWTFFELDLD